MQDIFNVLFPIKLCSENFASPSEQIEYKNVMINVVSKYFPKVLVHIVTNYRGDLYTVCNGKIENTFACCYHKCKSSIWMKNTAGKLCNKCCIVADYSCNQVQSRSSDEAPWMVTNCKQCKRISRSTLEGYQL